MIETSNNRNSGRKSAVIEKTEGERLKEIIKNINDIPSLPTVIAEVNEAIRNPRVDANTVGQIITRDQALSAKALKLVNSAFYGFPGKINSVTRAIIILGFQRVRNIVITATVIDNFKSKNEHFNFAGFWRHSLGTAVSAEVLARRLGLQEVDDAFVAGLLHDIGKLLTALYAPESFNKVRLLVRDNHCLMLEAEKELFQLSHAAIGAWLADTWQFPPKLTHAIRMHHDPDAVREHHEMVYLTHVADIICRALDFGDGGDRKIPKISIHVWKALKMDEAVLDGVMREVLEGLEKAKDFLRLLQ
jgi:putative nucleotidyltransferase with HDIG domain